MKFNLSPLLSIYFFSFTCLLVQYVTIIASASVEETKKNNDALAWNVRVTVRKRKKNDETSILNHAFGRMKPGSLHAIIGSSGSGNIFNHN